MVLGVKSLRTTGLYDNIPWKKVWTLSSKHLITNKVKEVSYKLLNLFYPVKLYMKKMFPDIDSLCEAEDESMSHLFLGMYIYKFILEGFLNFCTCFFFTEFVFVI